MSTPSNSTLEQLPLLPLRSGVLLPGSVITLPMGRSQSVELCKAVVAGSEICVAHQKDSRVLDPTVDDLLPMGTMAIVKDVFRAPNNSMRMVLEATGRFRLNSIVKNNPFWVAEIERIRDTGADDAGVPALMTTLVETVRGNSKQFTNVDLFLLSLATVTNGGDLADRVAVALQLDAEREIKVLNTTSVPERLQLVTQLLTESKTTAEVKNKIEEKVRDEFQKHQREAILREQMKAIRKELGEGDVDGNEESDSLRKKLEAANLPEEARKVADRELRRLDAMNPAQAEHGVIRNYLELIASLPWDKRANSRLDLNEVQKKLDSDHFGIPDVKKRILEHLAVLKMTGNKKGTVLCLAGPPGVGKTSLGQSIADATGRPFVRVSLGGVRDEAEIRGHRRTYIGALPGRIIHALKKTSVRNPVFLLDEIDKLFSGNQGSPEAALLEVLDPEQNTTFQDHYLELPFDLSEVLFICTANDLSQLSQPLRDRLEIIELSSYTQDEKFQIAKSHLIPKALKDHSLTEEQLSITDEAVKAMISGYTREAGVRQLTREIKKLCRAITLNRARQQDGATEQLVNRIEEKDLVTYSGKVKVTSDVAERQSVPGVATGMAWTSVGGDILFIETSKMPGKGKLEITGQLGDVMKESVKAALSYVRSNAKDFKVDPLFMDNFDLHVHVPAGATPKDGPSAGVTMFTAITSLLSGRKVRADTSMTGECTLRGKVLPVGGIKEKVIAANRAGIKRVILPKKNERDIDDIPQTVRDELEIIFAEDMREVLQAALVPDEENPPEVTTSIEEQAFVV